ncbi:oligosaccharide flippase family protein, partial [Neobacillus vireti]|uniref:oligosaccharide flippase family protein n=1 Tax=Neobacillus vireti TaxID=220686 RepID=UPI002FFF10BA
EYIFNLTGFNKFILNLLIIQSFGEGIIYIYNNKISLDYQYKNFLKISLVNTVGNIFLSLILILTIMSGQRYMGRIIGTSAPIILLTAIILFSFYKKAMPKVNFKYWKFGLLFSIPIISHGLSQIVLSQSDRIMIQHFSGNQMVGLYSFSYTIGTILTITVSSLDTAWSPWFFEQMIKKNLSAIKKRSSQYLTVIFLLAAFLILAAPEITKVLAGKDFWSSMYCTIPVLVGIFFSVIYTIPVQIEYYLKKTKYIALGTIGAAVINVILNFIFIPQYGYIAAAYTTLVSYMLYFTFHYIIAARLLGSCIFNTAIFVLYGFLIIILGILSLVFIKYLLIRAGIALIILILMTFIYKTRMIGDVSFGEK